MASKSLTLFLKTHERAEFMLDKHHETMDEFWDDNKDDFDWEKFKEGWNAHNDDLFRAAIVLSISAMDAYYTNRFCEALVPYLKKNQCNKKLEELLQRSGLSLANTVKMFGMDRPNRKMSNMVRSYLDRYVTQNFKSIDDLYLCYRIKEFTENSARLSGRKTLKDSVAKLVQRRHKIAHSGDYNSHGNFTAVPLTYHTKIS